MITVNPATWARQRSAAKRPTKRHPCHATFAAAALVWLALALAGYVVQGVRRHRRPSTKG